MAERNSTCIRSSVEVAPGGALLCTMPGSSAAAAMAAISSLHTNCRL